MAQDTYLEVEEFGFHSGDTIQEWLWDDDVDDSIRERIEDFTGTELVDEDYNDIVDGIIVWWRDGDDEDALSDTIMDALAVGGDTSIPFWIIVPKPGREGSANPTVILNAAQASGMNPTKPKSVSSDWNVIRLQAFGKGREKVTEQR